MLSSSLTFYVEFTAAFTIMSANFIFVRMNSQQLCFVELGQKKKNQIIGVDFLFEVFNDTDIKPLSLYCVRL